MPGSGDVAQFHTYVDVAISCEVTVKHRPALGVKGAGVGRRHSEGVD